MPKKLRLFRQVSKDIEQVSSSQTQTDVAKATDAVSKLGTTSAPAAAASSATTRTSLSSSAAETTSAAKSSPASSGTQSAQPVKSQTSSSSIETEPVQTTTFELASSAVSKASSTPATATTLASLVSMKTVSSSAATAVTALSAPATTTAASTQAAAKAYTVRVNATYGRYIDAADFGVDKTGKTDSLAAIKAALAAAHKENAYLHLSGNLYISNQIVINSSLSKVKGIFGDGMSATTISFDKAQVGTYNSNSNDTDIRDHAGILVDGVNNLTIADLAVKYTRSSDFYRAKQSYFGKISGILVNDADNTLISGVEVSGANRAGVIFTSTLAQTKPKGSTQTYKLLAAEGKLDENDAALPLGENNRIVNSYLHHNRVAGALVSFQEDFVADGNTLSWNGHARDGGTGYGIAAMAGSYNYGVTFTNNYTDHNYRKGIDVHDGTDIVISNNTSNGDRLYGIAVYNRQFAMDNVKITDNIIKQDSSFRIYSDDDLGVYKGYHGYSGIQLQTNTQRQDLHTDDNAVYEIRGNTISGLKLYQNAIQTYGIEFRNHEHKIDYTANIVDNTISGDSTKYLIAVINDTSLNGKMGAGSGTINIMGNSANIGETAAGAVPIYVEEKTVATGLRGEVNISHNDIHIGKSNSVVEAVQVIGNAQTYTISDNSFELKGTLDKSIFNIIGRSSYDTPSVTITDNTLKTSYTKSLYSHWVEAQKAAYIAMDNTHNSTDLVTKSNLGSTNIAAFTKEKDRADAADEDLTTVFDLDSGKFLVSSLFIEQDVYAMSYDQAHSYPDLGNTYTIQTEQQNVI